MKRSTSRLALTAALLPLATFARPPRATHAHRKLEIRMKGVGPLRAGEKIDQKRLEQMFRGAHVTTHADYSEGERVGTSFQVKRGGKLALVIHQNPTTKAVFSVEVATTDAVGPNGARVGQRFGHVLAHEAHHCRRGREERSGLVICWKKAAPNILFVGDPSTAKPKPWSGPDDAPIPTKMLHGLAVERIVWTPLATSH